MCLCVSMLCLDESLGGTRRPRQPKNGLFLDVFPRGFGG